MTEPTTSPGAELILGLDIGPASVGWALLEAPDGQPNRLVAAGVRVFEAGVEGDISTGKDTSRAATRREKRLHRRLLARRRHRLTKLATILQRAGLLPDGQLEPPEAAITYWQRLDSQLFPEAQRKENPHLLPYSLRKRALDEPLQPYELGRALYHLAHRRGFLSNRRVAPGRAGAEQEKEEGQVKAAITELEEKMKAAGARTVGEYLASLDPTEERVRHRYLGREMLDREFEAIWTAQVPHHPGLLTDELKRQVRQAIFFQRPLKSARKFIGECELEPGRRRAPMCSLAAQRFRLLQRLNDLRIIRPDGTREPLSPEQRNRLAEELAYRDKLTFAAARKLLGLPRECKLNFEAPGETAIPGCRTAAALANIFGLERWKSMSEEEREQVVVEMRAIHKPEALKRRAMKLWGLDETAAARLAATPLEDGYCNLSRQALAKLLPLMEQGIPYATARKQVYGDQPPPQRASLLPPLELAEGIQVRNPAVFRALTEVRKVVNNIIRKYGKPSLVRIELARDLRRPRKERQEIAETIAANRRRREEAIKNLIAKAGITQPTPADVEKWLLAEECGWVCPYTGRGIGIEQLFGDNPQFDVEHIIPLHRSLDNSFANKTLCYAPENRERKRNRTPWEAYYGTPQWEEIIARVSRFNSPYAKAKLELFCTPPEKLPSLEEFTAQQLSDTRYASRLAMRYLGLLFAANEMGVDPSGRRVIQATRGQVTAFLRNEWQLNFLGGGEKTREDHRQHAIDAIVVALTTPATIKQLSDAAARARDVGRRRFAPVPPPWPGFVEDVRRAIEDMVVSHRVSRKVSGPLHEETIYSPPYRDENGRSWVHRRKRLEELTPADVARIVDPAVRACVEAKLAELGQSDPKKAFKNPENHPVMKTKRDGGREIRIHKVRLRESVPVVPIGRGARLRHVKLGSNHHMEVIEARDSRGRLRWEGQVVSTLEAMRRLRSGQPVVQRDHGPGRKFLFSLARGETLYCSTAPPGEPAFWVVAKIIQRGEPPACRTTVGIVPVHDARPSTGPEGQVRRLREVSAEQLREEGWRKVLITPLGEVRWAND